MSRAVRVLGFGTYDVRSHPRVGVLLSGLAAHGIDVTECNTPLDLPTAARVEALRHPWRIPGAAGRVVRCWWALWRLARRVPAPDVVLVGYLGQLDVHLARRAFPGAVIVLDQLVFAADTAQDRGTRSGPALRVLRGLDLAAIRAADIVVVDTDENLALVPQHRRTDTVVVPVGAPAAWSAAGRRASGPGEGPLRVVFFGLFTPLQGTDVIAAALGLLDPGSVHVTMVGTGQDLPAARAAARGVAGVQWLPWVDSDDLPRLVADHDVCLGIFGTGSKAQRVVPNKVFQGAAAGCAVVTSDTPPQRRALGDAAVYVPPGDPAALADALRRLAGDRAELARLRSAARTAAEQFRPLDVVAPLVERLVGIRQSRALAGRGAPPLALNAQLRWDVVRRLLPDQAQGVLEVGCGQGAVAARLARRYPRFVAVEPDAASHAAAQARVDRFGEVRLGDVGSVPRAETFDLVCAFEVLEHLEDDRGHLVEWTSHLRPGGTVLVSTPAWAKRRGRHDDAVGHFRRYDPDDMRRLLASVGLVDVDVRLYGGPAGYLLESARNGLARRTMARGPVDAMERTARSGRYLQPTGRVASGLVAVVGRVLVASQRLVPNRGPGLVARGSRPRTAGSVGS